MARIEITVNGDRRVFDGNPDTPLIWVLRDHFGLTGTKFGCGMGICGACTVHDGKAAVRSCQVAASDARGKSYTTIEGLGNRNLHPCQRAWLEEDVAQCGWCQPGMIMAASALLAGKPSPSDADIDAAMSSLICRCGTYNRMRRAIHRAAALSREAE